MPHETRPRIVVIEDEHQIRRFLRSSLEAQGYEVFDAENGHQGVVETGTRKPDLVVLDLGLPDLDGAEVIRDIRGWCRIPASFIVWSTLIKIRPP